MMRPVSAPLIKSTVYRQVIHAPFERDLASYFIYSSYIFTMQRGLLPQLFTMFTLHDANVALDTAIELYSEGEQR
jgi:hypothetical protein